MKNVLIILGVLLLVGCAKEKVVSNHGVIVLKQEFVKAGSDQPYSGERIIQNDDGMLRAKALYVDGYPETVIYYYPSQQKKTKIFVGDKGQGEVQTHTEWYKNGQKKFEHHNDTLREWYENGQLKAEAPYDKNGDLHGITKKWDEDGSLTGQEKYKHGELVKSK